MVSRNRRYCRAAVAAAILILTLPSAGCFTLSVEPLHSPDTLVQDPGLWGVWGNPDDPQGETWQFSDRGSGAMRLVVRQEDSLRIRPDQDGLLEAHLLELNGNRYLDLFPEEPEAGNEIFLAHVVPAHSLWKIEREGDVLTLYALDSGALEQAIEDGRIPIGHIERDDMLVLTATTAELQDLVTRFDDLLFPEGESMQRIQ